MADAALAEVLSVFETIRNRPGITATRCLDEPNTVFFWTRYQLTVRVSALGDQEVWVIAGARIFLRHFASDDGEFPGVLDAVDALLRGEAVECLSLDATGQLRPHGWSIFNESAVDFGCFTGTLATLPVAGPIEPSPLD